MVYLLQFFHNLAVGVLGLDCKFSGRLFHIKDGVIIVGAVIRQYETFLAGLTHSLKAFRGPVMKTLNYVCHLFVFNLCN